MKMKWNLSRGRMKKIIIGGVIFFVLFTLFGFFALPPIVKSLLTEKLSEALHREVTIEQIKINPYALSVTIRGFLVKERGSSEKFVSFDELYVNLQSISAIKMAPVLREISLKQPYINVKRIDETAYNFSDLMEKKEPKPAEKPAKKPKPFQFSLNNIKIENGSIDFWDGPKQTKHTVKELNIGVPSLSDIPTQIETFVHPSFSAKINDTPYAIQGKTKPFADSLETAFDINIKDFDIPYYLAYFPLKMNFKIVSAYLDAQTKLAFIQYKNKGPSMTVTGAISLKKVALDDGKKNPLFRLPLLEIGIAPTEPLKKIIHLSKISIQSPELQVERNPKGALNIEALFPEMKEAPSPPKSDGKKEEQTALSIDVDEVELTGGKVSFSDLTRKKPFKTILSPIELKVDHFSNGKEKKTAYTLSIASEARENIKLEGELSMDPLWAEGGVEIKTIPLKKYSPYYQDQILFNLEDGRLDFSTRYRYAKGEKEPEISLSGLSVILKALRLKRPEEKDDFLKIPALSVKDTLVDVTQKRVTLGSFSTDKGTLILNRFKNGELDLQKLFPPSPSNEGTPAQDKGKGKGDERPWTVAINRMSVDQYTVKMGDQSPSQPTTLTGEKIAIRGENISTAKNAQGKLSLSLLLDQTTALSTKNTVSIDPLRIDGSLELKNIVLNKYSPYYQENILFNIEEGTLDLFTQYQYSKTEKDAVTRLSGLSLALKTMRLKKKNESEDFLNIPLFTIQNTEMDLNRKELSIGSLSTQGGALGVQRLKDGKLNLQTLFPEPAKSEKKPEEEKPVQEKAVSVEKPWLAKVGKINLDQYRVGVRDLTLEEPVTIDAEAIQLQAENLSTAKNSRGQTSLSLILNKKGTLSASGQAGMAPLFADLTLNLKEIDLRPYQPYFADKVKITLTDGAISTAGRLQVKDEEGKGVQIVYKGESALNNLATIDKALSEDFLKWKSLVLSNMDIGVNPFYVNIEGVSLTDFYSRIIINPKGVINLQEIMEEKKDETGKGTGEKPSPKSGEKKVSSTEKEPPQSIKIEKVTFQGGTINYSDNFIKPNVTVNMADVGGRVTGLSSEEITQADVELRGTFGQQSSPVEIIGKINPLKKNLFLDLKVSFKDIELSPMSPYSGKYTGYAIEKGKLFLDLKYHIENRKLEAQNRIFLDQFTFGEKIDSPTATKLPVKLAVALLKNRKGEIDLDIPVSGNLDDPKFSIFGIILKILLNLLVKAATSPFALLGAAFGGGEQLDYMEFDYGSSEIKGEAATKLNTLVKALHDRTSIKLDIEGYVDPEKDKDGLRQVFFQRKLKAQKLKEILKKGQPAVPVDEVKIEPAEYEKFLKSAYKEEKFPKPKNALGMVKDIPAPEMEKLMFTYIEVKEEDFRLLANQRALKVKEAIVKSGQVEPERVFIVGTKTLAPPKKEKIKESRVEFKLK
jgi:uncharacterized protein involved in outer membrane biogenesis